MLLGSGRELASRFQKLGSHLLKVLHFFPTLHFAVQNTTDSGKRCLFDIGLNAQGEQRWQAPAFSRTFLFRQPAAQIRISASWSRAGLSGSGSVAPFQRAVRDECREAD